MCNPSILFSFRLIPFKIAPDTIKKKKKSTGYVTSEVGLKVVAIVGGKIDRMNVDTSVRIDSTRPAVDD